MSITLVGLAAAFCTTVAFLPQVIQTWRTRSTKDISLTMFLVFTTGIFLWLVYGVIIHDAPLIAANGITFVLSGTILYFKLRHGSRGRFISNTASARSSA
jgi:MtN3 and saliva related transmembrane protein